MIQVDENSLIFKENIPVCSLRIRRKEFIKALQGMSDNIISMSFLNSSKEFILTDSTGSRTFNTIMYRH